MAFNLFDPNQTGHTGAWGTPEFGLTEGLQWIGNQANKILTGNQAYATDQGGSNLLPDNQQQANTIWGGQTQYTPTQSTQDQKLSTGFVSQLNDTTGGNGSGGQVLGTQDPNAGQPSGPSEADLINGAYEGYFKSLDERSNSLGGYEQGQNKYIEDQYGKMSGQSQNAYNRNENQLKGYETDATQNKATSIRDIGQDLMNSMQAGQIYLGTQGAGSSSAVGRMSEALSKAANRRTTDVSNQTNKILGDINTQKMNLKLIYDDEMSKLRQWKGDAINKVAQWVQEQRQTITDARGRMDFQRAQEVNNYALQKIADIDNRRKEITGALTEWAMSRSNNIGELQKNMTALGSFNVPGLNYTQLNNQYSTTPTSGKYNYFGSGSDEEKKLV